MNGSENSTTNNSIPVPLPTLSSTVAAVVNGTSMKKFASKENIAANVASQGAKNCYKEHTVVDEGKEGWPALNSISKETSSKRNRTKSERGSARQTPTEDSSHNNKK